MAKQKQLKLSILHLLTFPLYGSGSGTYVRYLAQESGKRHNVSILAPDTRQLKNCTVIPFTMPIKTTFTSHPEWKTAKRFTDLTPSEILTLHMAYMKATVKAVEETKPDIIHVHHAFPFSWAARFVKATYNIPYLTTIHGSELPTVEVDKRYVALTTDALRKSRRVIPNSFYTRDWLYKVFTDEYRSQVRVIPGGVDTTQFRPVKSSAIDKKYGFAGKKIVVFAGKLTKYKGVEYLVKAAQAINGTVVILGDGPERKPLEAMARERNITNILFMGHLGDDIDELVQFYSRADVFVAPSIWDEPLGLVILEAMACATPVVVTRKGGIPLAVKNGKNGLFVKARNSTDIAEKVNMLLAKDAYREKMAQTARETMIKNFTWEKIAARFEKYYEQFSL